MRVFVARLHLFAASVEHFFSPFLTKPLFLCIIVKRTPKGGEQMYEEIIRHLMKWQLLGMLLWTLLFYSC